MQKYNQIEVDGDTFHEEGSSELYFQYHFYKKEGKDVIKYSSWDSIEYDAIDWTNGEEPMLSIKKYASENTQRLINKPNIANRSTLMQYVYDMSKQLEVDCSEIKNNDLRSVGEYYVGDIRALEAEMREFDLCYEMSQDLLCAFIEREELAKNCVQIEELDLSVRTYNCLKRAGIDNLYDLSEKTVDSLMQVRNLGCKCLYEIIEKCKEYGIEIKED